MKCFGFENFLLTLILLFQVFVGYAQSISNLRLENGRVFPLKEDNQKLVFSYHVHNYGSTESYIKAHGKIWVVADKRAEFAGPTKLNVPASSVREILLSQPSNSRSFSLELIHLSRNSRRSNLVLPLSYNMYAPYGQELLPLPPQPSLYDMPPAPSLFQSPPEPKLLPNTVYRSVVNPVSVVSLLAGTAIVVFGQSVTNNINGNLSTELKPDEVMGAGLGIALLSLSFWKKRKHDSYASEQNRLKNQNFIHHWENEKNEIVVKNQNLQNRWNYACRQTELENQRILDSYQKQVNTVNEQNLRIKETFYIQIND
jgi:hypothetical protein